MALHVFFTPSAKLDLREARDHYRGQSEELAEGFVECAQFAVSRIASSPGQFAIVYKNVRQCPLKRFPFVISNILFWSNKLVYPLVAIVALVR